ncbi:MAG: VWA domain-containing protein [Caldilineaceae bacterium]|nr:VWA domain-containing protein [Caldilineaceae bacterium]
MFLTFLTPHLLWLLLLIPLTVGIALAGPRRPTPVRFWSGLVLRSLLLLLIILALAGVQLRLPDNTLTTVFVLDQSDSIAAAEKSRGQTLIRQAVEAMPQGDRAAIVIFGQDALVEQLASSQPRLDQLTSAPLTFRTDIESALQLAFALFPDAGAKRLVLLSDGQENLGQALSQTDLAAAQQIAVSFVSLGGAAQGTEVLLGPLDAPADLRQGESFDLGVTMQASAQTDATLRIYGDGSLIHSAAVRLQPGANRVQIPVADLPVGFHRFRAQITPDADTLLQNNEAGAFTVVHGPPSVLLVQGEARNGGQLTEALRAGQMQVTAIAPDQLPTNLDALASYDGVILANVAAEQLPAAGMEALQVYVRDLGRGLLMTGGENSFGAGGYLRTPLEAALPVEMDVRSKEKMPNLALALVVDKSGSMGACHCDDPNNAVQQQARRVSGQPKVDIAKEAILRSAQALGAQDELGVVSFDAGAHWTVEMSQLVDMVQLERELGGIRADGQTNMEAGVQAAFTSLQSVQAQRKHVILLTDGWGREGQLAALARQMYDQGITLSVVAAGGGSAPYLAALAQVGGGRFYSAVDMMQVPDFFLKETVTAVGRYIVEEPFYPLQAASSPVTRGLSTSLLPLLWGYNGATAKSTARIVLATPQGDPLLTTWQYGLGRAAAWTSDVEGRWAKEWVTWDGFATFAGQLVGWTLPAPQLEGIAARATVAEDGAVVHVSALDDAGRPRNDLSISAGLIGPDLATQDLVLKQVGAGEYEARTPLTQSGAYLVNVRINDVQNGDAPLGQQTVGVVVPYSPEYGAQGINHTLLTQLAAATNGAELADPLAAFAHNLPTAAQHRDIWQPLLLVVALLFPLDVALRRLLFGKQPLQRTVDWLRHRLPVRTAPAEQPAVLGPLHQVHERTRARLARPRENATNSESDTASSRSTGASPNQQPVGSDGKTSQDKPDNDNSNSKEADTFTRLRQAKRRAGRQSDDQNEE